MSRIFFLIARYMCTRQYGPRNPGKLTGPNDVLCTAAYGNARRRMFCAASDGQEAEIMAPKILKEEKYWPNLLYGFRDTGHTQDSAMKFTCALFSSPVLWLQHSSPQSP